MTCCDLLCVFIGHSEGVVAELINNLFEKNLMKKIYVIICLLFALDGFSHTEHEAEMTVSKMWKAFKDSDVELFSNTMAKDKNMVTFGTDVLERWEGWNALEVSIEEQFSAFDVININRKNKVLNYSKSGDTAWFSEVVDWEVMSGEEKTLIENIRFTGVLEKRGKNWKIVQFHSSAGVAGQVLEY